MSVQKVYCNEILRNLEDPGSETVGNGSYSDHEMEVLEDALKVMSIDSAMEPAVEKITNGNCTNQKLTKGKLATE